MANVAFDKKRIEEVLHKYGSRFVFAVDLIGSLCPILLIVIKEGHRRSYFFFCSYTYIID